MNNTDNFFRCTEKEFNETYRMKIEQTNRYEISADELLEMFMDENFFRERYKIANVNDYTIEKFEKRSDRFVIEIKRPMKFRTPAKVPSILKKIVKDELNITINMEWALDDSVVHEGTYSFSVEGIPVEVRGTMTLEPDGEGALNHMRIRVKSGIPVVGKKVAQFVGEKVKIGLEKDYQGTLRYIEAHHAK